MDDHYDAPGADLRLRRPVVDPAVPARDRGLLAAHDAFLTPASQDRPPRRRHYLPTEPGKRLATIDGAVTGITAAAVAAVFGATPLAVGMLVFQGTAGWEAASNLYALLLAEIIAMITAVILGIRIVRFGQPSGQVPAARAARAYHGRYLTDADFDVRSRVLLRRAQDAVDAVASSEVGRAGLLDEPAASLALASQEWDIALALREQARLRARRAELAASGAGPVTTALLDRQDQAARLADSSITDRVGALERYAAEVREADAAYRDGQQAAALAELGHRHLDMLARTAADEQGIAEIDAMAQQARAIRRALRPARRPGPASRGLIGAGDPGPVGAVPVQGERPGRAYVWDGAAHRPGVRRGYHARAVDLQA